MTAPSAVIKLMHLRASLEPASSEAPPVLEEGAGSSGMRRTHGGHSLIGGG